jgi:hypothetical protein
MDEIITGAMKEKLKKDAQIPHLPTDLTYECRMAVEGEGLRAYDWSDKPHRLVFDLCRRVEELENEFERLIRAVKDIEQGRSIHNDRKPDQRIEGPLWDALSAASASASAAVAKATT